MIYLAIFYFSSNLGIALADVYTEYHIHGRYKKPDIIDVLIILLVGLPFTLWLLITQD